MTLDDLWASFMVIDSLNGAKKGETLRYRGDKGRKYVNNFTAISVTISLSADTNMTDLLQREHPQILAGIGVGYSKLSIFDV